MNEDMKSFKISQNEYELSGQCIICGKNVTVGPITGESLIAWRNGTFAQDAFPNLNLDQREFIISGICGKCFDKMFEE